MKNNWNDDVAKQRKRGFNLPPDDYVYGIKSFPASVEVDGVAAALKQYCTFEQCNEFIPKKLIVRDFIAMNKATAKLGLTKTKDVDHFRALHDIKKEICFYNCTRTKKKSIPSEIVHGIATRTAPPIRDLIQNKYLHNWLHQNSIRRCKELLKCENAKNVSRTVYLTKASLLRQHRPKIDSKLSWKIPYFEKVSGIYCTNK
ncbi:unnamed protein product [Didymodactylos carnosus]|uniref:Uncharacterized protein n=1 Tax=Didymodactylos carnosus TaxID=1234261 RepID=A0A813NIJ7_9BILA|nr:unnamed protein product [Didymodactylos carnosus]CAF0737009.1 unnamed protein product [Didymodactylos carnosus]CAF3494852.1 unnamed protein product [Didymodactylos carnosus]CAF3514991.1 unnamed protein product [Didymodactylos carnosus]